MKTSTLMTRSAAPLTLSRQITFTRAAPLADGPEEEGADLTVDMAFASDLPYERWWGIEILDCRRRAAL